MAPEPEFILFDRASGNQLGEFATYEQAEDVFFRFVLADPSAADSLEIWDESGTEPIPVDPEKTRRSTTA